MEEFKSISELDNNYSISNLGNVLSVKTNKILNGYIGKTGYKKVTLSVNKKAKTYNIHLLVAKYFLNHNPKESNLIVDHKDSDKSNNTMENLQLITQRENIQKMNKITASKYLGVSKYRNISSFRSVICINKKNVYLANSSDESYLNKLYLKAVNLSHLYDGDNAKFRSLVLSK